MLEEAALLARLARFSVALARRETGGARLVAGNARFTSAAAAVARIPDDAVVAVSGLGGHQRARILFWALRERFERTGRPRRLTLVNVGGHGGRGVLPGTLEELALPGLCARLVTSHFETFRAFLDLAARNRIELQCLPLGVIAALYAAQARGEGEVVSEVGVGTFLDPRVGPGSPLQGGRREQWIEPDGDRLRYRLPPIDVALFNLPAADRRGNLYARDAAMVGDSRDLARAARRHGGLVIANVGLLVEEGYDRTFVPARSVDAIVCHADTEQTMGFYHRAPWRAVVPGGSGAVDGPLAAARLVRRLGERVGGFSARGPVQDAVARVAAATLLGAVPRGARVAIGTGLPEEVARAVHESGRAGRVTFLVESGVIGGVPAPGAYFGAAFAPRAIVSTAELFERCRRRLDAACLGALEIDAAGNVNVSRRGRGVRDVIGPGGFADFTAAARVLVFVAGWMRGGALVVEDGAIRIRRRGRAKLVRRLRERTFDVAGALRAGKSIFYVTPVATFRATEKGLTLVAVMPGIDVRRDVLAAAPFPIALPGDGAVPVVPRALVLGGPRG